MPILPPARRLCAGGPAPARRLASCALAVLGLQAQSSQAAPEEIEVYRSDLARTGGSALETNLNYVTSGDDGRPTYAGAESPLHRLRATPELSYGFTPNVELGALAIVTLDARSRLDVDGAKVRVRYIAPRPSGQDWYWGANLEAGYVGRRVEPNPWGAELRAILGVDRGRWVVSVNPTLEGSFAGERREPVSFQVQSKLGYRVSQTLILGAESYNSFGPVARLGSLSTHEQVVYVVADVALHRCDLNLGLGRGLDARSDGWVLKAVIGVPLR